MNDLHNAEKLILQSVVNVAKTYQIYEENFSDIKLEEIRSQVIQKISDWGQEMLEEFNNLDLILGEMLNREIIDES